MALRGAPSADRRAEQRAAGAGFAGVPEDAGRQVGGMLIAQAIAQTDRPGERGDTRATLAPSKDDASASKWAMSMESGR